MEIIHIVDLYRHYGLGEVATYLEQELELNPWRQHRITRLIVMRLFGTITGKRIVVLELTSRPTPKTSSSYR
jgi:UDPglucose 6-dehydrogenase